MLSMLNCIFLLAIFITQPLGAITTLIVEHSTDNEPGSYGEPGDLRYCINTMNESLQTTPDDFSIIFSTPMTIQLNGILPIINTSTYPVTISIGNSSHPVIIDGQNTYPGFFIPYGNVTIQNITFQNMVAKGGDGGNGISGGGGGMGAGGALYIPAYFGSVSNPQITLINVAMNNCSAVGGNGGNCLSTKTGY